MEPGEEFLQYAEYGNTQDYQKALNDLEHFVDQEGPFDGIMAFSQAAGLAASLVVHKMQTTSDETGQHSAFRCAIFFSGGVAVDMSMRTEYRPRLMTYETDGEFIKIPTAHIWGVHDDPVVGLPLSKLCCKELRAEFVHKGGHEIPGPKDPDGVQKTIRMVKRTLERARTMACS